MSFSVLQQCPTSNGQSGGLEESCGLQKVLRVVPQLFLQRCSMGPLLPSGFSVEGVQLYNMSWGLWSCLASLKRRRTVEHALRTMVLSGFSEEGTELWNVLWDCGPVWFL